MNNIQEEGCKSITEMLKTNTSLTMLELGCKWDIIWVVKMPWIIHGKVGNKIGDEGSTVLAEAIKINSTLTELSLRG